MIDRLLRREVFLVVGAVNAVEAIGAAVQGRVLTMTVCGMAAFLMFQCANFHSRR